jgi:aminomethyltransferase
VNDPLKRTPLYEEHRALGARLVPFAGYEMPVQYPSGINAEHRAVREAAGLFDVSHMGEFEVKGEHALDFLQYLTTNDVATLSVGQAQYSALLNENGTLIDDLLVYRTEDGYLLVVNASNKDRDLAHARQVATQFGIEVVDRSDETALIALQGPASERILSKLTDADLAAIPYYRFARGSVAGAPTMISRTGYTGEAGFELYLPAEQAVTIWRALLEAGSGEGLIPAGLGARDSLRLEMGYPLYGNDIDESRTPLEAGLSWITKFKKGDFIGRDALVKQKEAGVARKLVGFRLNARGFPRHGYGIRAGGEMVGEVTSGILAPSLGYGIGLAYVPAALAEPGTQFEVVIREQGVPAEVVKAPFYSAGTAKS